MESASTQRAHHHTPDMFGLLKEPRILIGVGLMLLGTLIGGTVLQRATARVAVWQVDHSMAAGTVLESGDVHIAEVAGEN